jgi:hypothetical protein
MGEQAPPRRRTATGTGRAALAPTGRLPVASPVISRFLSASYGPRWDQIGAACAALGRGLGIGPLGRGMDSARRAVGWNRPAGPWDGIGPAGLVEASPSHGPAGRVAHAGPRGPGRFPCGHGAGVHPPPAAAAVPSARAGPSDDRRRGSGAGPAASAGPDPAPPRADWPGPGSLSARKRSRACDPGPAHPSRHGRRGRRSDGTRSEPAGGSGGAQPAGPAYAGLCRPVQCAGSRVIDRDRTSPGNQGPS